MGTAVDRYDKYRFKVNSFLKPEAVNTRERSLGKESYSYLHYQPSTRGLLGQPMFREIGVALAVIFFY